MYKAKFDAFLFDQISLIKFCKNRTLKFPRVQKKLTPNE